MISGISHLTFIVQDLERSSKLFTNLFNAKEIYSSGGYTYSLYREKYFLINDELWICLMEGNEPLTPTYNHVAFKVTDEELSQFENQVQELKLTVMLSRPHLPGEGRSLYFYDYDNHLFEFHTGTLSERLALYLQEPRQDKSVE